MRAGKWRQARLLPTLDFLEKSILMREEDISNINNKIKIIIKDLSMLGGSLVTTAWRVLRLRMEGTASRYGG
jgi:hypothetical protein